MILSIALALTAPTTEEVPTSPCDVAIETQKGSNALELGAGSIACEEEGRAEDAAFLKLLAEIRATADLVLLPPQDVLKLVEREEFKAAVAGQSEFVDEELARIRKRFAALLDRVRKADLSITATYDPGWTVTDSNKRGLYAEVIDGLRTDKLAMESYVAKLVRDEDYFVAYLERKAIIANLREDEAQLPERFSELAEIMRARVDILGDPPMKTAVPWRKVYAPGPNAPFTVLHRGFNGPEQNDSILFRTSADVRKSWVGEALSEEELAKVLSRINFETEVLGVYAVGEMPNASQNLFVTEFGPNGAFEGHSMSVRVGVVGRHCAFEKRQSYPFVMVKASSKAEEGLTSTSRANYPDQCVPVMKGKPTFTADPVP